MLILIAKTNWNKFFNVCFQTFKLFVDWGTLVLISIVNKFGIIP
jgi:hypothetical protein